MLYYLLHEHFNVIQYISFRAAGAAITALFICFLIGPKIIRTLIVYHFGETIRHNGPESHHKKEGTPTMGGIIILMAIILPTLLWAKLTNPFIQIILISVTWMTKDTKRIEIVSINEKDDEYEKQIQESEDKDYEASFPGTE